MKNESTPQLHVRRVLPPEAGPVVKTTGGVLARQIQQRCGARVGTDGPAAPTVELALEPGIGTEGFRIGDRAGGGVWIAGNDELGLLAGVGKYLRSSRYDQGDFTPGVWRGKSLFVGFRPPSSGGQVGPCYTQMVQEVRAALAELGDQKYEMAGFYWQQGWNDMCTPGATPEYALDGRMFTQHGKIVKLEVTPESRRKDVGILKRAWSHG